jgi:phosphopantothenoylcysteine decarboxylase/phosphopantothenate--cysteine ligase
MHVRKDTGVGSSSRCLGGKTVLLAVSGGIAAVESVKLARELRRHGATVFSMMTSSAERVITPLALSWGSGSDVITDWGPGMVQLDGFDGVLLAPATRNTIAKHVHGIIDSPVMMALSAARGNGTPLLLVPSMHDDLFHDPVTGDLIDALESDGAAVLVDDSSEGRIKQPDAISIVAEFCNLLNSGLNNRKRVAITLGANRAPIDAVRAIQNASSGQTGWAIAEHLHRMGHEIICIAGKTSARPSFQLPDVRRDGTPDGMLSVSLEVAKSENKPEAWIHAAAVLDYYAHPEDGKRASGEESWELILNPGPKHISELTPIVVGSTRIGFKLEVDVPESTLVERAMEQIAAYGVDAVVANLMGETGDGDAPRCRIVKPDGSIHLVKDDLELCEAIEAIISSN